MTSLATIGSIVSIGAGAAGIYGALSGPGGGGGMSMAPTPLNPSTADLRYIFGQYAQVPRKNSIFGKDFKDYLKEYAFGPTSFSDGTSILDSVLGSSEDILGRLRQDQGLLDEAVNTARIGNETGFLTDSSAFYDDALRKFQNDYLPQIAETSGFGTGSSGFLSAANRTSGDLLNQANLQAIGLQEAATARRLQSAPLLTSLAAARESLPINLANDLYKLFGAEQGKPLSVFSTLSGLGNGGSYYQPGYNPIDPSGNQIGAIASGLGGIGAALQGFNPAQFSGGSSYASGSSPMGGGFNSYNGLLSGTNSFGWSPAAFNF